MLTQACFKLPPFVPLPIDPSNIILASCDTESPLQAQTSHSIFTAYQLALKFRFHQLLSTIPNTSAVLYIVFLRQNKLIEQRYVLTSEQFRSFLAATATMKQQSREEKQAKTRQTMGRLCSVSGLLLSVMCCIALIHVELRIQEHHRLISHSVTFCDNMKREIIRKVQEDIGRWQVMTASRHWQKAKGRVHHIADVAIKVYFLGFM